MSDLIQVLLRPVPERRPSAEQLLTCSKLDTEVKAYLSYVTKLREDVDGKERNGSQSSKVNTVIILVNVI
jgi:hypothetical protein